MLCVYNIYNIDILYIGPWPCPRTVSRELEGGDGSPDSACHPAAPGSKREHLGPQEGSQRKLLRRAAVKICSMGAWK